VIISRVEIYSDLASNSGVHEGNIPRDDVLSASLNENLDGRHQLTLKISRDTSSWSEITERRVLRVIYTDDTVAEFRIVEIAEQHDASGRIATIGADGIIMDLANGMVHRVESDGTITLFYTLLSFSVDELVTLILAHTPTYFVKGTIDESTTVVPTFTFDYYSPLKALQDLAALQTLELAVRRNGDTDYRVDLLTELGSTAAVPEFRLRKNLKGVKHTVDAAEMANRIYPAGSSDGAIRLSAGKARWEVTGVSTLVVSLDGDPIYEDDHLVGYYVEDEAENYWEITDSDATAQTITLETGHTVQTGDLLWFRELVGTATYKELPYVDSPSSQATYGIVVSATEEGDVPFTDNLVDDPAIKDWSTGDVMDQWNELSGTTVTQNTNEDFTTVGGASAKCVCSAAEQGIYSNPITIAPYQPMVYFSGFVNVYVVSGVVEFYWEHSSEGRFPKAGDKEAAYTSVTDSWVTLLIEGKEYPEPVSSNDTVTLYVISRDGAAEFYVDSAQFTNTSINHEFFEGNAANELWRRAHTVLDERSIPAVSYDINVVDLTAVDPSSWPYDDITLGGTVTVYDEDLGINAQVRAIEVTRDLLTGHDVKIRLSNKAADIIDILTRQRRRKATDKLPPPNYPRIAMFDARLTADATVMLKFIGAGATRSFKYTVSTSAMPTISEVISSGTASNEVTGSEVTTSTQLGYGQRAYVRAVSFPLYGGSGVAGETSTDVAGPPVYWNPSIDSSSVTQIGDGEDSGGAEVKRTLTVSNQQTAAARIFRRLSTASSPHSYPTTDGLYDGPLDSSYDRGTISLADGWAYTDGGYATDDIVWDIAIPIDHHGLEYEDPADREYDNYTVTGTTGGGGGSPYIVSMTLKRVQPGTGCTTGSTMEFYVGWTSADWDSTHEAILEQQIDGGSWEDITPTAGYDPTDSETAIAVPYYASAIGDNVTFGYRVTVRLASTPFTVYDTETKYAGPYLCITCPI